MACGARGGDEAARGRGAGSCARLSSASVCFDRRHNTLPLPLSPALRGWQRWAQRVLGEVRFLVARSGKFFWIFCWARNGGAARVRAQSQSFVRRRSPGVPVTLRRTCRTRVSDPPGEEGEHEVRPYPCTSRTPYTIPPALRAYARRGDGCENAAAGAQVRGGEREWKLWDDCAGETTRPA